jgi:hypothetical protein
MYSGENDEATFCGEVQPEVSSKRQIPGSDFGPADSSDCGQFVSREIQIAYDGSITFGPESFSDGESHMASYLALFGSPIEEDVVVTGLSGIFHSTPSAKVSTFWACAFQVLETEDSVLARVVKRAPFTIMGAGTDTEQHVTFSPALVVARGQFLGYMSTTGQIHCQVQYTASPETVLFASPCAPGQEAVDRAMSGRPIRLKICHCTLFLRWEMLSIAQVRPLIWTPFLLQKHKNMNVLFFFPFVLFVLVAWSRLNLLFQRAANPALTSILHVSRCYLLQLSLLKTGLRREKQESQKALYRQPLNSTSHEKPMGSLHSTTFHPFAGKLPKRLQTRKKPKQKQNSQQGCKVAKETSTAATRPNQGCYIILHSTPYA